MAGVIYKPSTRKGPVVLVPEDGDPPTITLPDGTVHTGVKGDERGGVYAGHDGYQWVFDDDVLGQEGAILNVGGQEQELADTNMSYRGDSVGSLTESSKGAIGSMEGGQYGAVPEFIGGLFPEAETISFKGLRAKRAPYNFIDPLKFAQEFGDMTRSEIDKNYDQAKKFGLDAVNTELEGLLSYVPKSAQLSRDQIAIDNKFNQAQREAQVASAVPGAREDFERIRQNAIAFSEGRAPDAVTDRALELGIRSEAADVAASSGFGVNSSAARKASDLMSARERIDLSKYGNDLLGKNVEAQANLFLADTQYSTAGSQVKIMPSISAGEMTRGYLDQINRNTLVSPDNALNANIDQSKFFTSLITRNREFNKTMKFNVRTFNANAKNEFALSYFNYLNSYVNSVAAGKQVDINTGFAIGEREKADKERKKEKDKTQDANEIDSIIGGVGSIAGAAAGFFGLHHMISV